MVVHPLNWGDSLELMDDLKARLKGRDVVVVNLPPQDDEDVTNAFRFANHIAEFLKAPIEKGALSTVTDYGLETPASWTRFFGDYLPIVRPRTYNTGRLHEWKNQTVIFVGNPDPSGAHSTNLRRLAIEKWKARDTYFIGVPEVKVVEDESDDFL